MQKKETTNTVKGKTMNRTNVYILLHILNRTKYRGKEIKTKRTIHNEQIEDFRRS